MIPAAFSGLWLVAVLWGLWNFDEVFGAFVGMFWGPLFALTGMALAVCGVVSVRRKRGRSLGWCAITVPLLIAILCCCSDNPFHSIRVRLRVRGYEPVVAQLAATPAAARRNLTLADTIVAKGEPLRVAFVQPGSVLDNFIAVVYDPTGEVLKVNRLKRDFSDRNDPEAKRLRTLITGDMTWAEHLEGPWYLCSFT